MKCRTDFVTNSSSASFVIQRKYITDSQLFLIVNYREYCKINDIPYDWWDIEYNDEKIAGFTTMENEDILKFLTENLNIPRSVIYYENN